jgi:hypothetical protein
MLDALKRSSPSKATSSSRHVKSWRVSNIDH